MQVREPSADRVPRLLTGALGLAALFACASCNFVNEDELAYRQVSVKADRSDSTSAPGAFTPVCLTAPLLIGSKVEQRQESGGSLVMRIVATADAVELSFSGAKGGSHARNIDIVQGVPSSVEFQVESFEGAIFSIKFNSPCN